MSKKESKCCRSECWCPHCENAIREVLEEDHELDGLEERMNAWMPGITLTIDCLKDLREINIKIHG